jgi:microcystin-dependent protein
VRVPLSTDNADGPKLAKDMVDTLASSTALLALIAALIPAGTIRETITIADEPGWARMGTTITNGQTLTPALWGIVPVGWRSGANIVLPDWSNRGLVGAGTIAMLATGGANTRSLVQANLPPHAHDLSNHNHNMNSHTHTANHNHAASAASDGYHNHGLAGNAGIFYQYLGAGDASNAIDRWDGGLMELFYGLTQIAIYPDGSHTHPITVDTINFSTGGPSNNATTGPSNNSTSNGFGTSTPIDTTPASVGICYKIKAH